jgi:RNA polymerase sigma-70 factor (ECF subfamily)
MNQHNADWISKMYSLFKDKVYGYFFKRLHSLEQANDLTSQVFLEVARCADRFDNTKSSESTWIYTISRNICNRYFRDTTTHKSIVKKYGNPENRSEGDYEASEIERFIQADTLKRALSQLSEHKRRIIILSYYHGLNPQDIAERLKLSYTNVCAIKSRALKELRKFLNTEKNLDRM